MYTITNVNIAEKSYNVESYFRSTRTGCIAEVRFSDDSICRIPYEDIGDVTEFIETVCGIKEFTIRYEDMEYNEPDPLDTFRAASMAASLYDGGWRSSDHDDIQSEYNMSDDDMSLLIRELEKIERRYM